MARIVLLFWLISRAAAATYSVSVIPNPDGFVGGVMFGINDSGQVAGYGQNGGTAQAFLGSPSGSTPIPLPSGWSYAFAIAVNASGQVAGSGSNGIFVGSVSGSAVIPVPTGWSANIFAINASGEVAGYGNASGGVSQGFIGTPAGISPIAFPPGANEVFAQAVNSSGQVAGSADFASGGAAPFIGTTASSTKIPLPAGWLYALASAVNDSGQVAGTGSLIGQENDRAFIGTTAGSMAIPLPIGATSATVLSDSINNPGQVIGRSDAGAWIWDAVNGTRLLNTLVPAGWKVDGAFGISNNGLILASASYNGGDDFYVELTPVTGTSGCSYSLTQATAFLTANAAGGAVNVVTAVGCGWTASSNSAWLTIGTGATGSGSGAVNFQMNANPGSSPRTGVLTIAGLTFPVTQAAAIGATTLAPSAVTPGAGSGMAQTFTFSFTDQLGASDLSVLDILINNYLDGRQACYFAIVPGGGGTGALFLVDDAGDGGYANGSPLTLPSSGTVGNSQCSISAAGGSVFTSGNNMTVSLNITFAAGLAGNKIFYMAARSSTQNSGWQALGTWNVPGAAPIGPGVGGMFPARSTTSGEAYDFNFTNSTDGTYSFTFADTNGYGDLGVVNILVNNFLDGSSACYLAYAPTSASTGYLYLVDDAGDGGYAYGSGADLATGDAGIANEQCLIYTSGSSASASGNTLTLNLRITFLNDLGFAGNHVFYLAARDKGTGNSGWQAAGSVTVP